jgi:hypothetical protein
MHAAESATQSVPAVGDFMVLLVNGWNSHFQYAQAETIGAKVKAGRSLPLMAQSQHARTAFLSSTALRGRSNGTLIAEGALW